MIVELIDSVLESLEIIFVISGNKLFVFIEGSRKSGLSIAKPLHDIKHGIEIGCNDVRQRLSVQRLGVLTYLAERFYAQHAVVRDFGSAVVTLLMFLLETMFDITDTNPRISTGISIRSIIVPCFLITAPP